LEFGFRKSQPLISTHIQLQAKFTHLSCHKSQQLITTYYNLLHNFFLETATPNTPT
jgi:hypothetical protein